MKETREKEIINKIFTKKDIRSIWNSINKEYISSRKKKNHSSIELIFNCADGVRYETEKSDLLADGDIIDLKKAESVSIHYYDYKLHKRIVFTLRHGNHGSGLTVIGEDRSWVARIFDQFKTILEAVKPQDHWLIRYKNLILHLSALGIGFTFYTTLDLLWFQHMQPIENPSENILTLRNFFRQNYLFYTLIQAILFWLQGLLPAFWVRDWIMKLWPSVEFDFGPEHQKIEKMRRVRIGLLFSIVIIPLILNFIFKLWN